MIVFEQKGNFKKLDSFLERMKQVVNMSDLDKYGREGVEALKAATPRDTGTTAESWYYTIERESDRVSIIFNNSNIVNGIPIAVILQYGHATGTGGYVEGIDYINPALKPVFDKIANDAWSYINDTRRK